MYTEYVIICDVICMYWDTNVSTGIHMYLLGYKCVYWDTNVCTGIQMYVLGYQYKYWDTNVSTRIQMCLLGYKCIYWDTNVSTGVQMYVLGYKCVYWDTNVCTGIPIYLLGYKCIYWDTNVSTGVQMYLSVQRTYIPIHRSSILSNRTQDTSSWVTSRTSSSNVDILMCISCNVGSIYWYTCVKEMHLWGCMRQSERQECVCRIE